MSVTAVDPVEAAAQEADEKRVNVDALLSNAADARDLAANQGKSVGDQTMIYIQSIGESLSNILEDTSLGAEDRGAALAELLSDAIWTAIDEFNRGESAVSMGNEPLAPDATAGVNIDPDTGAPVVEAPAVDNTPTAPEQTAQVVIDPMQNGPNMGGTTV